MYPSKGTSFFGIMILLLLFCFIVFFYYINEPFGDAVLAYYDGHYDMYIPEYDELPIKLEGTRGMERVVKSIVFAYLYFGGRVSAYIMGQLGRALPRDMLPFLSALILFVTVYLTLYLSVRKSNKVLYCPVFFLLVFVANYWCRGVGAYYVYMFTMVYTYLWPILLGLLFYAIVESENVFDPTTELKRREFWLVQLLGFMAGFGHEIVSLMILGAGIIKWYIGNCLKTRRLADLKIYIGYIIGYACCFLAPGNFRRASRPHDAITTTYSERLYGAISQHYVAIMGSRECKIILAVLIICAILVVWLYALRKQRDVIMEILLNHINFLLVAIISIPIWAFMPSTPAYGTFLFSLLIYAFILSFATEIDRFIPCIDRINVVGSIIIMIMFIAMYGGEIKSFSETTFERRRLVAAAVNQNLSEVIVPRYSESLNKSRYLLSYLNDQKQYDTDYYIYYYGVRMIIK